MQPQPHPKFDVFLSHKSSDKEAIRDLKRRLEGEGLTCWLDEDDLLLGDLHADACPKGISESRAVLACIGADGLGPWQTEEVYLAFQHAKRLNRRVIPVLFPGAPEPEDLPSYLPNRIALDLRKGISDDVPKRIRQAIEKPLGGDATVANSRPATPSDETARPIRKDVVQPSPAASADPRPMSPEEEKRRTDLLRGHLSKAFPGMLESLRKAVSEDSELRDLLVRFFKPEARAPEAQALELLFLFHEQFLESLGHFGKMYSEAPNAAAKERVKRLAGQALFLAMSPGYAEGLHQRHEKANGATLPMDKKAGWGVQQILACWVHRKSQVAIQSPPGGTMDVPPQRKVQTIKEGLMARFAIPPSDPSAERRLAEEIEAALNFGDIVVETVDDEAVLREIRDKDSPLRDLMVFFISDGASIRPELRGQPFDSRVSVHFKRLTTALSTP